MGKRTIKLRIVGFALALALVAQPILGLSVATESQAAAKQPVIVSSGLGAGVIVAGGVIVSVASIITCAALVGAQHGRELTPHEMLFAGLIPLGCLFAGQN